MIVALLLLMAMPMMAERVTPETARKVAATFLNNNGAKTAQLTDLSKEAGFPNLYIFNGNPGFVVMAADDCVQPILGYSLTDKFVVNNMPENMREWLQGYSDEIQFAIESKATATIETVQLWNDLSAGKSGVAESTVVVGPLIQTTWGQEPYYNDYCPYNNTDNRRTVTGCVATAMAQIMKYHSFPPFGIGTHTYTPADHPEYGVQSANFGETTYNWSSMPNSINSSNHEIAQLMYHCGVSVDMDYDYSQTDTEHRGSSASTADVVTALTTYFNYSTDAQYITRASINNDDTWIQMMKDELDAHRPMQYRGQGNGGHSFVCDGYRDDDSFHFNWGWRGSMNDSYFFITNLNPGGSGTGGGSYVYNNNQAAIFGIHPATPGEAEAPSLTAELVQTTNTRNAQLTWTPVSNATSYQLYYNTELIYSGTETSYIQEHIPYGTNTYFVRSVDASGNLSWPSNYESITITFPAPTNLTAADPTDDGISLSWTAAENAVAYNVYCNGVFIASNITTTTYTDSRTIAGTLRYYVKGVDELGDESDPSDAAEIIVAYKSPTVEDLAITLSDNNAMLSWNAPNWCYPETASESLFYGSGNYTNRLGYGGSASMCWGHRYLASELECYNGLVIYKVSFYVGEIGTYQCMVYKGTETYTTNETQNIRPITQVANVSITTSQTGWIDIDLGETIDIDASQDLWVFMLDPEYKGFPASYCTFTGHTEGCYYTNNNPISYKLETYSGVAWLIKTCLTDGVYTYHLYDNETSIADNIVATGYTVINPTNNTAHQYTLKTKYYGGNESTASNMVGITLGTASLNSLELGDNDQMTITEGSKLTVSGTLSNTDAGNLVLKNGAQLIHSSEGVQATILKDIFPYTSNTNGWNFIASPVTENFAPSTGNGFLNGDSEGNNYDLYYYNEPTHLWKNYERHFFNIEHKKGYLYANGEAEGTTLKFVGTLLPSNTNVTISNLSYEATEYNGFNLVGNPFACEATVDKDFYVISGNTVTMLASTDRAIAPCEGIFVKATNENNSVTFTRATTSAKGTNSGNSIDLVIAQKQDKNGVSTGSTTVDRARVRFGEGIGMEKFSLDDQHSQISLWQNGQDFAVAYADGASEMPINFKAAENGTYTLAIDAEGLDLSYLHLIDNMTGENVDLLSTPNYTFEGKTTDYTLRFKLVFAHEEEGASTGSAAFAYINDGNILINGEGVLQIVDMMGRVIVCSDVARNVSTAGLTPGVYVLRLIDGENVRTQKIVIE